MECPQSSFPRGGKTSVTPVVRLVHTRAISSMRFRQQRRQTNERTDRHHRCVKSRFCGGGLKHNPDLLRYHYDHHRQCTTGRLLNSSIERKRCSEDRNNEVFTLATTMSWGAKYSINPYYLDDNVSDVCRVLPILSPSTPITDVQL